MSAVWDWRRSSTTDNVLSLPDHVRVLPAFPLSVDEEPNQDANEHAARHQDSPTLAGSTDLGTQKLRTQAEQHVRISIFPTERELEVRELERALCSERQQQREMQNDTVAVRGACGGERWVSDASTLSQLPSQQGSGICPSGLPICSSVGACVCGAWEVQLERAQVMLFEGLQTLGLDRQKSDTHTGRCPVYIRPHCAVTQRECRRRSW